MELLGHSQISLTLGTCSHVILDPLAVRDVLTIIAHVQRTTCRVTRRAARPALWQLCGPELVAYLHAYWGWVHPCRRAAPRATAAAVPALLPAAAHARTIGYRTRSSPDRHGRSCCRPARVPARFIAMTIRMRRAPGTGPAGLGETSRASRFLHALA